MIQNIEKTEQILDFKKWSSPQMSLFNGVLPVVVLKLAKKSTFSLYQSRSLV